MRIDDIKLISADGEELPPYVYHGTSLENAKIILKQGLEPSKTIDRGEHNAGYIFLSWTQKGAAKFASGGIYNNSPGPGVVLEIKLDPELAKTLRTNLGEFIRCPVHISPDKIRIL